MHSMTGYGRATREVEGRQLTVELKSVNHRFLDINFHMPRSFAFLEDTARKIISANLARGHVELFITYKNVRADARVVHADITLAEAYMNALQELCALGARDDRSVSHLSTLPDVLRVEELEEDQAALGQLLAETLEAALKQLKEMRRTEGETLLRDLRLRLCEIQRITDSIEDRYPETIAEYTERLKAAVRELAGQDIEESRLITEVAIMADRSAIQEEIVRLKSHLQQMDALLDSEEPVGRRIDFIVQELNREVNTISSKSQDIPITRLTVDAKAEIEKLREQIQNVE